jgi:hypothetical protein
VPDTSHLSAAEREAFTEALLNVVMESDARR